MEEIELMKSMYCEYVKQVPHPVAITHSEFLLEAIQYKEIGLLAQGHNITLTV